MIPIIYIICSFGAGVWTGMYVLRSDANVNITLNQQKTDQPPKYTEIEPNAETNPIPNNTNIAPPLHDYIIDPNL